MNNLLTIYRRGSAKTAVLLLLLAAAGVGVFLRFGQATPKPDFGVRNVLLISIDTCRADHLSCYGFKRNTTPNIDALAADGVLFQQAQSTNPLTLPAHSSMMTGTIPPAHGVLTNQGHRLSESNTTLAEVLRDDGFQTAAVVGAFPMDKRFGLGQGFQSYDDDFGDDTGKGLFNEATAEQVSKKAIRWLDGHSEDPFFLFVHYYDPHQRYLPPEPFATEYPEDKYSGEIAYTDHWIGKIIDRLKELGQYESTAIIVTSDHGESLGDHNENSHGFFIYQPTIHIPFVARLPQGARGQKINAPVSIIDIMPTILGLVGSTVPEANQGIDLSQSMHGGDAPADDRYLYSDTWYPAKLECCPLRGLRQGPWRYIWSVRPELYNLHTDPRELKNVYGAEQRIAQRLHQQLLDELEAANRSGDDNQSELDDETKGRLESLGYLGSSGGVEAASDIDETMNDPKDRVHVLNQYYDAMTFKSQNRLEDAKAACLQIMQKEPRMLHAHFLLGEIANAQGDRANAAKHYSDVLVIAAQASKPETLAYEIIMANANLGMLSTAAGNLAEARNHFAQVLTLEPDNSTALSGLGEVYFKEGNTKKAESSLLAAVASDPRNKSAWSTLGEMKRKAGNHAEAIGHFQRVLELQPDHAPAHQRLAAIYTQLGDEPRTIEHLEGAVKHAPNQSVFANDLAWVLATSNNDQLRNPQRAVRLAKQAAEATQYSDPGYLDTLSVAQAASGDFAAAIQTAEKALKLAESAGHSAVSAQLRERLGLFRKSIPYRQPPATAQP